MSTRLYWLQCGGCGGDTMSLLNAASPDLVELLELLGIQVLWHPSLSNASPHDRQVLLESLLSGEQALDVLCVEGAMPEILLIGIEGHPDPATIVGAADVSLAVADRGRAGILAMETALCGGAE